MAQWTMTFEELLSHVALPGEVPDIKELLTPAQLRQLELLPIYHATSSPMGVIWSPMLTSDLTELFMTRFADREIASETVYSFIRSFQRTWGKAHQAIALQEKAQVTLLEKSADELLQKEKETLARNYEQSADSKNDRIYSDTPNEKLAVDGQEGYYTDRTYTTGGTKGSGNEEYTRLRSDNQAKQYLEITKVFENLNQKFLDSFEDLFLDFYALEELTLIPKRRF